ncbi:MAG: shikimate kinase [Opitutaceae bacterium]
MNPTFQKSRETQKRTNLYLVGFMGTGKSTVARMVAQRLGMEWLDSDAEIERQAGRPISDIFARDGESGFRQLERAFIEAGHPERGCVVSCGGGLVLGAGMIGQLKSRGVLVCLQASAGTIHERTRSNQNRPLLNVENPEERIAAMLREREPYYRASGTQILTDHRTLLEVVAHVCRVYQREARDFERVQRR